MSQADAPAADWYPDPSGRFQFRYWDGESWTGHVSTDGQTDWDPPEDGAGDSGGEQTTAPDESPSQEGAAGADAATSAADDQQGAESGITADDSAFAPQAAAEPFGDQAAEPQPADAVEPGGQAQPAAQPESAQPESAQPESAQPAEAQGLAAQRSVDDAAQGGTIEEGEPSDTNLVANQRAEVDDDVKGWLDEVAAQVEPRLSRINREWTMQPQAEAARACAYGLLVGHLAHLHPHMREDLSKVAESHPSFTTLEDGARLDTLEQIARDPQRTAAWLGPLIGTEDTDKVQTLFD